MMEYGVERNDFISNLFFILICAIRERRMRENQIIQTIQILHSISIATNRNYTYRLRG